VQSVSGRGPGAEGSDELDVSGGGQKRHHDPPLGQQLARPKAAGNSLNKGRF